MYFRVVFLECQMDSKIAKVNTNGVITAVNPGTCNIVSVSNEGGYEVNTCMTVLPAAKTAKAKK